MTGAKGDRTLDNTVPPADHLNARSYDGGCFMKRSFLIRCTVLAVVGMAAVTSRLYAVDRNNTYYAYGVGQQSCGDYIKLREKKLDVLEQQHEGYTKAELYEMSERAIEYWMAGFLTAHDLYVADTFNVAANKNMDDLKAQLESICRSNPKQYFAEAMFTLARQLNPQRAKTQGGN
jgi:hypothetical protein